MNEQDKREFASEEKSSDEIRAEIARTRERLAEDVEALGHKLSPENVKREAKEALTREVRHQTERVKDNLRSGAEHVREGLVHGAEQVREGLAYGAVRAREGLRHGAEQARYGIELAGTSVRDSARANPLPLVLVGAGVGWLVWNAISRARSESRPQRFDGYERAELRTNWQERLRTNWQERPGYRSESAYERPTGYRGSSYRSAYGTEGAYENELAYGSAGAFGSEPRGQRDEGDHDESLVQRAQGLVHDAKERTEQWTDRAVERAHDWKDEAQSRVQQLGERTREKAEAVRDRARDAADDVRVRAREISGRAREGASRARDNLSHMVDDNPLMMAALAIAAGITVGLLLPRTSREDRLLGSASHRLMDGLKEKAHEAGAVASEAAKRGAEAARDTAMSEAERRHLIMGSAQPEQGAQQGSNQGAQQGSNQTRPGMQPQAGQPQQQGTQPAQQGMQPRQGAQPQQTTQPQQPQQGTQPQAQEKQPSQAAQPQQQGASSARPAQSQAAQPPKPAQYSGGNVAVQEVKPIGETGNRNPEGPTSTVGGPKNGRTS